MKSLFQKIYKDSLAERRDVKIPATTRLVVLIVVFLVLCVLFAVIIAPEKITS